MVRVLVTGAGGYIGSHAVTALVNQGAEVIALQRTPAISDARAKLFVRDFSKLDRNSLSEIGHIDVVLHMAWTDGFNHNAPSHMDHLSDHARFVRLIADAGIGQFVGLGSMHEVGYWEGVIDESTPHSPRSMYGVAKNALRESSRIEIEKSGAVFQWLRCYYILGDDRRSKSLFAKILAWEDEGKATFPFTSGLNKYDFISVEYLGQQIAATCLQKDVRGVIECCSGQPISLREKVETFLSDHNLKIRPDYGAYPDRSYDSPEVWGSAAKIDQIMSAFTDRAQLMTI